MRMWLKLREVRAPTRQPAVRPKRAGRVRLPISLILSNSFKVREDFCDFTLINSFVDQEFIDCNQLFVVGRRLNAERMTWEYFVRSRKEQDYRQMLFDTLYHPPQISVDESQTKDGSLYLSHRHEGKPLVTDYIANTLLGIEYLWGGPVDLETSEVEVAPASEAQDEPSVAWNRVRYRMEERNLSKIKL